MRPRGRNIANYHAQSVSKQWLERYEARRKQKQNFENLHIDPATSMARTTKTLINDDKGNVLHLMTENTKNEKAK